MNRNLQTTALGALGGFLGFLFAELLSPGTGTATAVQMIVEMMVWTALYVLPLTLVLVGTDNVLGLRGRWWRGLGRAVLPTLLLGAFAGGLAQLLYGMGLDAGAPPRLIRGLGWAVMGAGVGLVLGLADRSWTKAWRGLLGGAAGGLIGGLLFDSFGNLSFGEGDTGVVARAVGLTLLGAAIGSMLRLSQELFKTAWLEGTGGRYEGKRYILTKPRVTLGRSDSNDIGLYADAAVPLQAGALERQGETWRWAGEGLAVNGQPAPSATLRPGDRLSIGQTTFVFQSKVQAPASDLPTGQRYMLSGPGGQITLLPGQFERVTLGTRGEVKLSGPGMQPQHAELWWADGRLELLARGPTALNGQALTAGQRVMVRADDHLQLGGQDFQLLWAILVPRPA